MVVMELGEYERGEEKIDAGSNHNPCVVTVGWVPPFLAKSGLKKLRYVIELSNQTTILEFLSDSGVWVMSDEI